MARDAAPLTPEQVKRAREIVKGEQARAVRDFVLATSPGRAYAYAVKREDRRITITIDLK